MPYEQRPDWLVEPSDLQLAVSQHAKNGDEELLWPLLSHGLPPNGLWIDGYGKTALHWAVIYCRAGTTRMLIEAGADIQAKTKYHPVVQRQHPRLFCSPHPACMFECVRTTNLHCRTRGRCFIPHATGACGSPINGGHTSARTITVGLDDVSGRLVYISSNNFSCRRLHMNFKCNCANDCEVICQWVA